MSGKIDIIPFNLCDFYFLFSRKLIDLHNHLDNTLNFTILCVRLTKVDWFYDVIWGLGSHINLILLIL